MGNENMYRQPANEQAVNSLWRLIEIYHAVVYFVPERQKHYAALGLKGGWMGYFATRSGALGRVPPEVVTACFYNFKHAMVARALPDAWLYTTPEEACRARLAVFDEAARRMLHGLLDTAEIEIAAQVAHAAVAECDFAGRPLAAAHAALPVPSEPHLALFWAAGVLREYRGDGHNAALAEAGIDGCEAHVLMAALGLVPADQRSFRGWSDEDWAAAAARLAARGWLDTGGGITDAGRRVRADVESTTERLAGRPWQRLGPDRSARLHRALTPLAAALVTAGALPYPNAVGVPPVAELCATQ